MFGEYSSSSDCALDIALFFAGLPLSFLPRPLVCLRSLVVCGVRERVKFGFIIKAHSTPALRQCLHGPG